MFVKLYGVNLKFKKLLTMRFELTTFSIFTSKIQYLDTYISLFYKKIIKSINIILSQVNNVNLVLHELKNINILRMYLVKSYRGYCHSIGKPVRGQRTWSNS